MNAYTRDLSIGASESAINDAIEWVDEDQIISRIWKRDVSVWRAGQPDQIAESLGWLNVARDMLAKADELIEFSEQVRAEGFAHVVLLGMGGSSLCPEVLRRTFGVTPQFPELLVLDSTVPDAIRHLEQKIDLANTLFIVASKSGAKIEPRMFLDYFFNRASQALNRPAGPHFIAITDAQSPLEKNARSKDFRRVFVNPSDIGGRYSALSYFGMAPAALAGYNIKEMLTRAVAAMEVCQRSVHENPAAQLGATIGALARQGRDKLSLIITPPVDSFGLWIEQLIAESTGKLGRGIVPVAGERLGTPDAYGADRAFVLIKTNDSSSEHQELLLSKFENAGHPIIRRVVADPMDLGFEFFVWEFATAIAGAIIDVNPFDQPNVEESLHNTATLLEQYEEKGHLPEPEPLTDDGKLRVYLSPASLVAIKHLFAKEELGEATPETIARRFLGLLKPGDYLAITPFIEETAESERLLDDIRIGLRNRSGNATTIGYGPRYLHSTGQLHKGGAANGVFIQINAEDQNDVEIPNIPYTFGTIKQAQALGDFNSLVGRERSVIRFDIGPDVQGGLSRLRDILLDGANHIRD